MIEAMLGARGSYAHVMLVGVLIIEAMLPRAAYERGDPSCGTRPLRVFRLECSQYSYPRSGTRTRTLVHTAGSTTSSLRLVVVLVLYSH